MSATADGVAERDVALRDVMPVRLTPALRPAG